MIDVVLTFGGVCGVIPETHYSYYVTIKRSYDFYPYDTYLNNNILYL